MSRSFFKLGDCDDGKEGNSIELDHRELNDFDYLDLNRGKQLHSLPSGIVLALARNSKQALDCDVITNPMGWKIVSERLADVFRKALGSQIEILPVQIQDLDGGVFRKPFFVLNPLRCLPAISEQSVRGKFKIGSKYPIIKIVISSRNVPQDTHAFRLDGDVSSFIIDDFLKRKIEEVPHDGFGFNPVAVEEPTSAER